MHYSFKLLFVILIPILFIWGCSKPTEGNKINLLEPSPPNELNLKVSKTGGANQSFPQIDIAFVIPEYTFVHLEIKNATGYTVKVLYDDYSDAGTQMISWDGSNDNGEITNKGIYIIYLKTSNLTAWYPQFYCWEDCE